MFRFQTIDRRFHSAVRTLLSEPWTFSKQEGNYGEFNAFPAWVKDEISRLTREDSSADRVLVFQLKDTPSTFFIFAEQKGGPWVLANADVEHLESALAGRAKEYLDHPRPWWKVAFTGESFLLTVVLPLMCIGLIYGVGAELLWHREPLLFLVLVGLAIISALFPFHLERTDRRKVLKMKLY